MATITKIHEIDAYGCHISIEKMSEDYFHATVSYKAYNELGVHIASPEWGELGTGEEVYMFILKTVSRAVKINHPVIDIQYLN